MRARSDFYFNRNLHYLIQRFSFHEVAKIRQVETVKDQIDKYVFLIWIERQEVSLSSNHLVSFPSCFNQR